MSATALRLAGISKRYGSVIALDDASFALRPGSVHALLGENGAGKTTLMRVAFGMVRSDAGRLHLDDREVEIRSPADAIARGVGMVHQHFTLVPRMTVLENFALGGHGMFRQTESRATVRRIAALTGFALDPDARVERLPIGAQQRVEIAKALAWHARILVLDEPTAVLAPSEADELLHWLRRFVAAGNSAVLITHKLREALSVADDLTVLRRGRVVSTGPASGSSVESLTTAMMGVERVPRTSTSTSPDVLPGAVVFRAERLSVRDDLGIMRVRDASFAVHAGEIVGIAGVEGSGQRELLRALAGRGAAASGGLTRPLVVGFIPEDRHRDAVLLARPLTENVALRGAGMRRGTVGWAALRDHTVALMHTYDVRAPGAQSPMRTLSGGNQQKLVLAREMEAGDGASGPHTAIVAESPTRGLDVRAAADVHDRLRAARDRGAAIVVYSSDLDEVLSLASRVLVTHAGTVREVPPDRGAVGRAMLGLE